MIKVGLANNNESFLVSARCTALDKVKLHHPSDQGRSFDNKLISSLCKMYGIRQSTTTPYNPCSNSQCECFNRTLFGLMRMLDQEQKPNWPIYLPSLVFAYNATHTVQWVTNHMSSCLGARLPHLVIIG